MIAVVTNIDADHLSSYEGELGRLKQGFTDFLHNLPFYGLAVMCRDDPNTAELIAGLGRRVTSYGSSGRADVRVSDIEPDGLASQFIVHRKNREPWHLRVNLPGRHNVLNALAAVTVAQELGIEDAAVERALAGFSGIDRRFQVLGTITTAAGRVTFVDDYGHHPTEIAATIAAARDAWPDRRLVLAFQPHRYTRTHDLIDDFAQVLSDVDLLLLTEVYAAGEEPIAGADGKSLTRAVRTRGAVEPVFVESVDELAGALANVLHDDDVVLTLGAGSIGGIAATLPAELATTAPVGVKQ
jgi:UDP-N-acetylmuramate--alanine ligase